MRFSSSVLCGVEKLSLRPKYFCVALQGSISTVRLLMCAYSGCCLGLRVAKLCRIFVLSGCSSSPVSCASAANSPIIVLSCGSEVANNSTSSANRRFVSAVPCCGDKWRPHPLFCHFCCSRLNMDSDSALKSKELSGSPCFVPRWMSNTLLRVSVLT